MSEDLSGGQGAVIDDRRPRQHMQMVRRAIREGWPISQGVKAAIVHEMTAIVTGAIHVCYDDEDRDEVIGAEVRSKIAAAKVLVAADSVNVAREKMDQADEHIEMGVGHGGTHVNVNVGLQLNQTIQNAVGTEPDYLEWIRQRELAQGGNADAVGPNGFAAKIPDTTPRLGNGSGGNGHAKGHG